MAHDALLVLSFGGPEGPDDVIPFLRNVTQGRNVPDERLAAVAAQYQRFGGRSPINAQCRALIEAVRAEFRHHCLDLPVYWGNRNWHPLLSDTLARMISDGVRNALVFVTSAFGSYSGCRQYLEDLDRAAHEVGPDAPALAKLRLFYNHPGFISPLAEHLRLAWHTPRRPCQGDSPCQSDNGAGEGRARVVFTAHSLPQSMAAGCDYEAQLQEAARLVLADAGLGDIGYDLVFQSRSGPPSVPWLEPDINDHLITLAADGIDHTIVVPIGFVSDHFEVLFDLDTQARETAERLGIGFTRVPTVGAHPRFVTMIRELVEERHSGTVRLSVGTAGPWPDQCPAGHCPPPPRHQG